MKKNERNRKNDFYFRMSYSSKNWIIILKLEAGWITPIARTNLQDVKKWVGGYQLAVSVEDETKGEKERERCKVWIPADVFTNLGEHELPPLDKCLCLPLKRGVLSRWLAFVFFFG